MVPAYRGKLCFVNKLRTLTDHDKMKIMRRDDYICQYCGERADCIDHVIPHSFAPDDSPENLVAACSLCNSMAYNKMFKNFNEKRFHILDMLSKACTKGNVRVWTRAEVMGLGPTLRSKVAMSCVVVDTVEEQERVGQLIEAKKFRVRVDMEALLRARLV